MAPASPRTREPAVQMILGLAIAGAAGTLARYWIGNAVGGHPGDHVVGTIVVNVTGSFLAGLAVALLAARFPAGSVTRSSITIGFLGAYTTFSTLSLQSYRLLDDGSAGLALAYAAGSVVAGVLAVTAGVVLGRAV